jgi:glycosyltransferase involved in cell wall biosynthesis
MRILLVGQLPPPIHGSAYANAVFLKHSARRGHVVRTINTNSTRIFEVEGARFSMIKALRFLRTYLRTPLVATSDVIYMTPGQTFYGLLKFAPFVLLARLLGKPYVLHIHGNNFGRQYRTLRGFRKRLFRHLVTSASAGIVLSPSLRQNFDDLIPADRVFVVENFAGDELRTGGLPEKPANRLELAYLSNLMREKGIFDLLDALADLKRRGIDFRARIAGNIEAGLEATLQERFSSLAPEVEYLGALQGQSKIDLLWSSNVFVLPTYYSMEGQPISILEAMATGNIIVTTNHAGIPDIVDGSNGYLLPKREPAALAACLARIAGNIGPELARVSATNVRKIAEGFSELTFADKLLAILGRPSM